MIDLVQHAMRARLAVAVDAPEGVDGEDAVDLVCEVLEPVGMIDGRPLLTVDQDWLDADVVTTTDQGSSPAALAGTTGALGGGDDRPSQTASTPRGAENAAGEVPGAGAATCSGSSPSVPGTTFDEDGTPELVPGLVKPDPDLFRKVALIEALLHQVIDCSSALWNGFLTRYTNREGVQRVADLPLHVLEQIVREAPRTASAIGQRPSPPTRKR